MGWAAGSWQLAAGVFASAILVSLIVVFAVSVPSVFAQTDIDLGMFQLDEFLRLPDSDPRTIAVRLINLALQFVGVLMLVLVLWGGVLFMFSGGKEEGVKKATSVLKNAIIGLIIVLSAWGIVRFVLTEFIAATSGEPISFMQPEALSCGQRATGNGQQTNVCYSDSISCPVPRAPCPYV